jgi:outer membrane receptor for ferrienterochelin and colicins
LTKIINLFRINKNKSIYLPHYLETILIVKIKSTLILLFTAAVVFAQHKDTITVNKLSEVVVTGQFEPQSVKKSVFNVKVISQKDIQQLAANNLADVLNQYLNITIMPSGSEGRSTVSMFGLDGQYFKILVDNIPIVSDSGLGNNIDLTQINLNDIEQIEIIEGSMGVTHGANAVSGILNIITKKRTTNKWDILVSAQEETVGKEYRIYNQGKHIQSTKVGHQINDNWFATLGVNRNDFDGFLGDQKGKEYEINDGKRGYRWLPKEQWVTNALLQYSKGNFRLFYKFDYLNESLNFYHKTVNTIANPPFGDLKYANDNNYFTNRFFHHLNASGKLYNKYVYTISASHQKQARDVEEFKYNLIENREEDLQKFTDQSTEVIYSTGTISNLLRNKICNFQVGYEFVNTNGFSRIIGENNFIKDVRKRFENYDIFLSSEVKPTEKFFIRPGFRYSIQSFFDNQYAASLGLRYLFDNGIEARTSLGKSYRTPNFEEMFSEIIFSGHYFIGNENLKPEKSTSYEASLKKQFFFKDVKMQSQLAFNFIDVKDRIDMALVETLPIAKSQYININKYQTLNFALTKQLEWKEFNANLGFSIVGISQEINNGEAVSSNRFLYTNQLNASLSYFYSKLNSVFSIYYKHNGKQERFVGSTDVNGNPNFKLSQIDSFSWMDASIKTFFWNKKFETTLGARNIFNITDVQQSQPNAGSAHPTSSNLMLGYGRSYFLKLVYNINF